MSFSHFFAQTPSLERLHQRLRPKHTSLLVLFLLEKTLSPLAVYLKHVRANCRPWPYLALLLCVYSTDHAPTLLLSLLLLLLCVSSRWEGSNLTARESRPTEERCLGSGGYLLASEVLQIQHAQLGADSHPPAARETTAWGTINQLL